MALINGAVGGGLVIPPTAASGNFLPLTGGTMSGPIVMGNNKITSLAVGTNPTDAVAFSQISGLVTGVSSVFTRTGAVTAANGDYTVSQVTGAAPLASPTFTGTVTLPDGSTVSSSGMTAGAAIAMATHKITGIGAATVSTDAASLANRLDQFAAPAASVAFNAQKITGLANGSASTDAAAFGQIPVPANGYGITGNTGAAPTPAVGLSNASGNIGSPVSISNSAYTDIFSTASLAVGTWLVRMIATLSTSTTGVGTAKVVVGTGTATFSGVVAGAGEVAINGGDSQVVLDFIATVTVAGTIKMQIRASTTGLSAVAADSIQSQAGVTGYTAIRIA